MDVDFGRVIDLLLIAGYYNNGYDNYQAGYGGAGDCPPYGSYGRLAYGGQPVGGGYRNVGSRGGGGGGSGGGGRGGFNMGVGGGQGSSRGRRPFIGGVINRRSVFESQTGHSVHMRGLPYSATEDDVAQVRIAASNVYCVWCAVVV